MAGFRNRAHRITERLEVPSLKAKLQLLFRSGRNQRITNVASLDREPRLSQQRSFRQYYRNDRANAIPADLVDPFLDLFCLSEEELRLPYRRFEILLQRDKTKGGRLSWSGAEAPFPKPSQFRTDGARGGFAWERLGIAVEFVSESAAAPIEADDIFLFNLRRR